MAFEKSKAQSTSHTEEEIKTDLKPEEDTSTDAGQSEENDTGSEEDTSTNDGDDDGKVQSNTEEPEENSAEYWKQKFEKSETDKTHYQQGLISEKASKRAEKGLASGQTDVPADEQAVIRVMEKQNERKASKEVINPKSTLYLPELVDDSQYNEIIEYLPHNIDKSSVEGIHRALKIAVRFWKEEKGIVDKAPVNKKAADVAVTKTSSSSGVAPATQTAKGDRKIIKKTSSVNDWYTD